jgi:predicted ATP-dependent endonuclease of OLD family
MLRRIEVDYFRSLLHFRLDIPASYLCIVGDNNAGKSNIVTALKWLFDPAFVN